MNLRQLIILLPLLTPLITSAVCLVLWRRTAWQRSVSLVGVVAGFAASLALFRLVAHQGIQRVQVGNWPAPFGITIVADLLSAIMVAVACWIGLCVLIYSLTGIDARRQSYGFHALFHLLLLGVCGAFLTGDLFDMYVWFEVMLISSFVLVALGGEQAQLEGAIKYVTLNLVSSAWFLAAAGTLYSTVGTLNMADLAHQLGTSDARFVPGVAMTILLISFGIKAGVFPLFFWLPASYHTPPAAVSALLAGLLTKVGVYALVRLCSLLAAYDTGRFQVVLLTVAGWTMVTGVLGAAAQQDMRRILSFHIISQIGYMIMGLAIFTPLALAGMVFYLVHHIVVKTNLFLVAGIVQRLEGSNDLAELGGLYRRRFGLSLLFLIPALSLAGIPPLSGFWAKLALVRAGLEAERYWLVAISLAVSLLTLFSMTKIWGEVFWKERIGEAPRTDGTGWVSMVFPAVLLAGVTIFLGLSAESLLLLSTRTAEQLLDPTQYIDAVLVEG